MGIRGLKTYIDAKQDKMGKPYSPATCKVPLDTNVKNYVVMNGSAFKHHMYFGCNEPFDDDCPTAIEKHIDTFLNNLMRHNIYIKNIIFDGGFVEDRLSTQYERRRKSVNESERDYSKLSPTKGFSFPSIVLHELLIKIFIKLSHKHGNNFEVRNSVEDADRELACIAKRNNYFVIGNDSDLFMFDIRGYIDMTDLEGLQFNSFDQNSLLTITYYSPELVSQRVKCSIAQFPLFGVLSGTEVFKISDQYNNIYHSFQKRGELISKYHNNIYYLLKQLLYHPSSYALSKYEKEVNDHLYLFSSQLNYDYPYCLYNNPQINTKLIWDHFLETEEYKVIIQYLCEGSLVADLYCFLFNHICIFSVPRLSTSNKIDSLIDFIRQFYETFIMKYFKDSKILWRYICVNTMKYVNPMNLPLDNTSNTIEDIFVPLHCLLHMQTRPFDKNMKSFFKFFGMATYEYNASIYTHVNPLLPVSLFLLHKYIPDINPLLLRTFIICLYTNHIHAYEGEPIVNNSIIEVNETVKYILNSLSIIASFYFNISGYINNVCYGYLISLYAFLADDENYQDFSMFDSFIDDDEDIEQEIDNLFKFITQQ
ncbi:hypothetical protein WA158_002222 [Blastocystis sp. Blastoise]